MDELTILEGATFCICNEVGDIDGDSQGLFSEDTRFLSKLRLKVNGKAPLLLSSDKIEYFSAAFFTRNPLAGDLGQDEIAIRRERFVGDGMQDRIVVENESMRALSFDLELEFGADFADIMSVKEHDFVLGDPMRAAPLPAARPGTFDSSSNQFVIADDGPLPLKTQVILSQRGEAADSSVRYRIELEPRERWELNVDVFPLSDGEQVTPHFAERRFGEEMGRVRDSLAAWQLRIPQIRSSWDQLGRAFNQSVSDLASLRMNRAIRPGVGNLPAAGMPWFMTVFGRDTLLTCLQTLLFGPELARTALHVLAELQATVDDPSIDAEPGKIVHEVRHGKAALKWFARYYGTVDATPLYLILLSEVWRWTDDRAIVRDLKEPALAALRWIDEFGDRDGDGFVEYEKRAPHGLDNQSWKDSGDSQRFHDGTIARAPIAPCEVQGYVYDAKRRIAELSREVWRDRELSNRLDEDANRLRARFDEAFWVPDRGGFYALALDGEKRQVDSLCSNIGHLLWSGIVPPERIDAVVDRLMGDELWSGWGVRTMSTADAAYNPLSYHTGTVWPHDNSLIAWGLARSGRWSEAQRIVQRMLTAAGHFDFQLPEVFAGMRRSETPFPIAYPTAARPQAWAAGTSVLLLRVLLGLEPDRPRHSLETLAPPDLPSWAGSIRLTGVRAFERMWDVRVEDGQVHVEEAS
ncbi:MAG TPA: glycogen debranching N-terminal domain-containing protein [Gaiellaceae bacterium]|nr:glycogen debranching N-terminal domain-containing protein [Gaiellaceae bacterium]